MQLDDWDKILNDVASDETKEEYADEWWCVECEYGPMTEKETTCSRCGIKNSKVYDEEPTGWEDEDIESEVEEIW